VSSVPAGKRSWRCPECGAEVLLSMTQLDPMACDACLAKMKGGVNSSAGHGVGDAVAGPLGMWQALPEIVKLGIVVVALVLGFVSGLLVGFIAGRATASHPSGSRSESTRSAEATPAEEPEDRPPSPGPGHKWVRGRIRKDGTRGAGHWAKDPYYKGDDEDPPKKSSN